MAYAWLLELTAQETTVSTLFYLGSSLIFFVVLVSTLRLKEVSVH